RELPARGPPGRARARPPLARAVGCVRGRPRLRAARRVARRELPDARDGTMTLEDIERPQREAGRGRGAPPEVAAPTNTSACRARSRPRPRARGRARGAQSRGSRPLQRTQSPPVDPLPRTRSPGADAAPADTIVTRQ